LGLYPLPFHRYHNFPIPAKRIPVIGNEITSRRAVLIEKAISYVMDVYMTCKPEMIIIIIRITPNIRPFWIGVPVRALFTISKTTAAANVTIKRIKKNSSMTGSCIARISPCELTIDRDYHIHGHSKGTPQNEKDCTGYNSGWCNLFSMHKKNG
jgi:hypothetical protein